MAVCDYQSGVTSFAQLQYGELSPQTEDDIRKDLPRTFSEHPYFAGEKGKTALKRVLKAFALQFSEIGYCQGLNYIAAFLLLVSGGKDDEVFTLLCHLIKFLDIKTFYTSRFPGLWKAISQFNCIFEQKNRKLYQHVHTENAYDMTWLGPWMLSLYTTALPFQFVIRVWDLLLVQGLEVLIKLALKLVDLMGTQLLRADMEGMAMIFGRTRVVSYDIETIMKEITDMKLDPELMRAGARKYEAELSESARNSLAVPSVPSIPQGNEKCPAPQSQD